MSFKYVNNIHFPLEYIRIRFTIEARIRGRANLQYYFVISQNLVLLVIQSLVTIRTVGTKGANYLFDTHLPEIYSSEPLLS